MSKFIELQDRVLNVDAITGVEQPRTTQGVESYITINLNPQTATQTTIKSFYNSYEAATNAYTKIVKQLCEGTSN